MRDFSITIFTPTYNRAHTLGRLYDSLCKQTCKDFEWLVVDDGSTDSTRDLIASYIAEGKLKIRYIYKENGGLHTGYNTAYANIDTELSMCMDSDDFLPDDAVEIIKREWQKRGSDKYAGLVGVAYDYNKNRPIDTFPEGMEDCFFVELTMKKQYIGDSAPVLRTDLMNTVAPQIGFEGEKNFNPSYMMHQVCDKYPLLVVHETLMVKEYQEGDSMSKGIFRQYMNSPRSFAKMRIMEMQLKHNTLKNKFRCAIHYISSCIISKDNNWYKKSQEKTLTILAIPFGIALYFLIRYKTINEKL